MDIFNFIKWFTNIKHFTLTYIFTIGYYCSSSFFDTFPKNGILNLRNIAGIGYDVLRYKMSRLTYVIKALDTKKKLYNIQIRNFSLSVHTHISRFGVNGNQHTTFLQILVETCGTICVLIDIVISKGILYLNHYNHCIKTISNEIENKIERNVRCYSRCKYRD